MAEAQPGTGAGQDGGAPLETKRRTVTLRHMRKPDLSLHYAVPKAAEGGGLRWQVYLLAAFVLGRWLWGKYKGREEARRRDEGEEEEEEEEEDDGFDMSDTMNHRE